MQQRGWGHASVIPPNDVLHSLQCPQVPHAHKSVMIQGYRQHKDLLLPSTHKPVAPAAGAHQTSKLQNRPLWTAPLLHHPFPKVETTDTELTALPLGIPTSHPHAQPWERLGFFGWHFCPALQPFSLLTQAKGQLPQHCPCSHPSPKAAMLGGRQWLQSPQKGKVQPSGMVWEPLWGARSRNCGVRERGRGEGVARGWL